MPDPAPATPISFESLTTPGLHSGVATALAALLGGGGGAFMASREKARDGETRQERTARIVRNAVMGAGMAGAGTAAALGGAGAIGRSVREGKITHNLKDLRNKWLGSPMSAAPTGVAVGGAVGYGLGRHAAIDARIDLQSQVNKATNALQAAQKAMPSAKIAAKIAAKLGPEAAAAALAKATMRVTSGQSAVEAAQAAQAAGLAGAGNTLKRALPSAGLGALIGGGVAIAPEIAQTVTDYAPNASHGGWAALGTIAGFLTKNPKLRAASVLSGLGGSTYSYLNRPKE